MTRPSHVNTINSNLVKLVFFLGTCLVLSALSGCGDRISSHGHIINENELAQINIGTTTRAEVLDILGQPSFAGAFNPKKLYYSSQVMLQPAASLKQTQQRLIYVFTVDHNDMLESIDVLSKEDGLKIVHIDKKTPTPGDTLGILDQIFSNIKRQQTVE